MFFNPHMKDIMVRYHQAEQRNGFYKAKDVLPYMIVAGVVAGMPTKPIRKRFPKDVIAKLEELKWWDLPEEKLKEHITLFQKENVTGEELERLMEEK